MQQRPAQFLFAILLLIAIIIAGCGTKETANLPLFAKLSELKGKVGVQNAGENQLKDAKTDTVLQETGRVETGEDGRVRLDLSSGTILRLGPTTLFTLISNEEAEDGLATRIKLEAGRLFIILKGGNVEVETPSGVAAVRGSYLMVEVDPETHDVLLTCLEGDCMAENDAGSLNFTNGQKTVLFHKDPVTGKYTPPGMEWMTEEDFQQWLDENPEAASLFNQAMATLTAMAVPTQAPTEAPTQAPSGEPTTEQTAQPTTELTGTQENLSTPASSACITLVFPPEESGQPYIGEINFQWESTVQAAKYVVVITYPNGAVASFETTETNLTRYLESMPGGGGYTWSITALDQDGKEICRSSAGGFSKPAQPSYEERKKKKQGDQTEAPTIPPTVPPTMPPTVPPTGTPCSDPCNPTSICYDPSQCFKLNYDVGNFYSGCLNYDLCDKGCFSSQ